MKETKIKKIKFLADMGISPKTISLLKSKGYHAVSKG